MNKHPLVLLGHGVWLQMVCALVARHLRPYGYRCLAVELPADSTEPASVACGPELETICQMLGLPLQQLLRQAQGCFSLGCQYQRGSKQWFVPFGFYGLTESAAEFDQGLVSLLQQQPQLSAESFCIAALAASQGKFGLAPDHRPDLRAALSYGLHLKTTAFAASLKTINLQLGVGFIQSTQLTLHYTTQGQISSVELDHGRQVPVSYCLDCRPDTDSSAASNRHWLSAEDQVQLLHQPFSTVIHTSWGWLVRHPLQQGSHWHTEFDAGRFSLPQIRQELTRLAGPQHWSLTPKSQPVCDAPWQHNHLRWGQAAAALDCPLQSGLNALQYLVIRWLDLLPNQLSCPATATLYNQHWQQYQHEMQNFLQLHQQPLATEPGRVFARLGRLMPTETNAIKPAQWFGLMYGLGLRPDLPSMLLANRSETEIRQSLQQVQQQIARLVAAMPSHAESLSRCLQHSH